MDENHIPSITRMELIELLNQDLSLEVHSVTCYVNSSRRINDNSALAESLKLHAEEEITQAMTIAAQIDALGGAPAIAQMPANRTEMPDDMLGRELESEAASISRYRKRVEQCEMLGELEVAQFIRRILAQDMEHFSRLAAMLTESGALQSEA